jgi:hypothetical protein
MLFDKQLVEGWYKYLPFVQRIINTEVHDTTGVSPAALLYGNATHLDRGILCDFTPQEVEAMNLSEWTSKMLHAQHVLLEIARKHQRAKDRKHMLKPQFTLRTKFPINSYVFVEYPPSSLKKGPTNKFMTNLKGPMRVVSIVGNEYTLLNLVNNKEERIHITRLHPFNFDPSRTDPREVANKDAGYVDIDHIIQHWGNPRRKANMQFLVRWVDSSPEDDSWLAWKDLRTTAALHAYLRKNNMDKLIPEEFK